MSTNQPRPAASMGSSFNSRDRITLVLDALILGAGAVSWVSAPALALGATGWLDATTISNGSFGFIIQLLVQPLLMAAALGAPLAAWLLHQRRITGPALLGAVIGGIAVMLAAALAAPLVSTALGFLLRPLTTWEYAGPIAFAVVLGISFAIAVAAGLILAHCRGAPALARLRWLAVAGMIALAGASWAVAASAADPELLEAGAFAAAAGISAAGAVAGADLAGRMWHPRHAPAPTA